MWMDKVYWSQSARHLIKNPKLANRNEMICASHWILLLCNSRGNNLFEVWRFLKKYLAILFFTIRKLTRALGALLPPYQHSNCELPLPQLLNSLIEVLYCKATVTYVYRELTLPCSLNSLMDVISCYHISELPYQHSNRELILPYNSLVDGRQGSDEETGPRDS